MREGLREPAAGMVGPLAAHDRGEHQLQARSGVAGLFRHPRKPCHDHPQGMRQHGVGERVDPAGLQALHRHREDVQGGRPAQPRGCGERHHRVEDDSLGPGPRVVEGEPLPRLRVAHGSARLGVGRRRRARDHPLGQLGRRELRADEPAARLPPGAQLPYVLALAQQDGGRAGRDHRRSSADGDHGVCVMVGQERPGLLD